VCVYIYVCVCVCVCVWRGGVRGVMLVLLISAREGKTFAPNTEAHKRTCKQEKNKNSHTRSPVCQIRVCILEAQANIAKTSEATEHTKQMETFDKVFISHIDALALLRANIITVPPSPRNKLALGIWVFFFFCVFC